MEKMAARWLHGCYVRAGTGQALVRPLEFPTFRPSFAFWRGFGVWCPGVLTFWTNSQRMIEPGRASDFALCPTRLGVDA